MEKLEIIEVGDWLGTANKIRSMHEYVDGWRAVDSYGKTYRQTAYPYGLLVSERREAAGRVVFRTPWPEATEDDKNG